MTPQTKHTENYIYGFVDMQVLMYKKNNDS